MGAKITRLGALGFLMGMVMGVLMVAIPGLAHGNELSLPDALLKATGGEASALLAHMLISGVYGIIPMAGVVIYDIDSWGLLKQAVVHYLSYTVAFVVIARVAGWFESPADLALTAGIFLVCHCIIWLIMYLRCKAETEQLNALLQQVRRRR